MFTRQKIQNIFKDSKDDFQQKNKIQNVNSLNEKYLQKSLNEVEDVEVLPDDHEYLKDDYNNRIKANTLNLRKANTPIESLFRDENNFSVVKPNKSFATEESVTNEETNTEIRNSVDDTFHRAAGPILFLGQCFALMPVQGVLDKNPKHVKFFYKSPQVIYSTIFLCSSSLVVLSMMAFLIRIGINAKNFVGLVFFSCVECSTILFALLAPRWPEIIRYWSRVESIFTQKPYEMPQRNLATRVRVPAIFIIICLIVEHALYLTSAVLSYKRGIELCASIRNYTQTVTFEDYVYRNYSYIFEILPANIFAAIFVLVMSSSCTFIWNYMDLFIMIVSKGIAYRFEQITRRINKLADKEIPEPVFIEIREHYVKLCELLEFIDENLSGIILLCCINNLYFVCFQLLNIFNKLRWPINYIYFWFSLLYLIGRTSFVLLSAAAINDESKAGLSVLRRVSPTTWCAEVERLIFEMTTQTVALSGKKFYFLTRRLLFGMAGTIVTYELVLLQFDEPNRVKGLTALCA